MFVLLYRHSLNRVLQLWGLESSFCPLNSFCNEQLPIAGSQSYSFELIFKNICQLGPKIIQCKKHVYSFSLFFRIEEFFIWWQRELNKVQVTFLFSIFFLIFGSAYLHYSSDSFPCSEIDTNAKEHNILQFTSQVRTKK